MRFVLAKLGMAPPIYVRGRWRRAVEPEDGRRGQHHHPQRQLAAEYLLRRLRQLVKVKLSACTAGPKSESPLWPERFPREKINELRFGANKKMAMHPLEFARAYMCECRDDASALCKSEWIEACKRKAREMKVHGFVGATSAKRQRMRASAIAVSPARAAAASVLFHV